jgi:hypothetical protein
MRITRVALSFFSVGFVAGSFEQAAGLGDAQPGHRASTYVASAAVASMSAPSVAPVPVAIGPAAARPISPPLAPPPLYPVTEPPLSGSTGSPLLDMGDARAAEAIAAAFTRLAAADESAQPEGTRPLPKLRPFFELPEEPPLVVPEPQPARRPTEFIMPIGYGRVTSMWNQGRHHPAIDLAAPLGTPVRATTRRQKVTFAGRRGGYGNLVITRDSQGRQHYYGHLHRIVAGIGTLLEQGDLLGLLGSTGRSTGPHVHYEVRKSTGGHFNPAALLFPGFNVQRGYAWNDGGRPAVAAARSTSKAAAARGTWRRTVRATRTVKRRNAGRSARRARFATRAPAVRYYTTQRAARSGVRHAARPGQPRPR